MGAASTCASIPYIPSTLSFSTNLPFLHGLPCKRLKIRWENICFPGFRCVARGVCVCGCRGEQAKIVAIIIIVVGRAGQRRKDTKCSIKKKMIYTHQNKLSASRLAQ